MMKLLRARISVVVACIRCVSRIMRYLFVSASLCPSERDRECQVRPVTKGKS